MCRQQIDFKFLPGEEEALQKVKEIANSYGYGNLIQFLRREWKKKLVAGGYPEYKAELAVRRH